MDYNMVSCGVAGQTGTVSAGAQDKIHAAIAELFKAGYRRFLVALTGEAALLFAEAVLPFREQYPDAGIDLLIPFNEWADDQPDSSRFKRITGQAESVNYSCEEEYEDSIEICNRQLVGFGRCLVAVHDGKDKEMAELIGEARAAEQNVKEVLI
ncbi:MAG: hypothetical protein LBJ11_03150 [Oscillospiraceae bacterium]|jgi:uncharacterized phage-like protein YoqJ|nr:hypothetical protein [Oscillospiraceae bacterium]